MLERCLMTIPKNSSRGMYFVVGSGPAGIACAQALIAEGASVTILDAGLTLEPEREAIRAAMASRNKVDWTDTERTAFAAVAATNGMVPMKLTYGSDYPYRLSSGSTPLTPSEPCLRGSYAQGGLSNVWGGAILPYRDQDIAGWPVSSQEMALAYREIMKTLPLTARYDELATTWPLYTDRYSALTCSSQAKLLLQSLEANRTKLYNQNIRFGGSRLAVAALAASNGHPCNLCGECLNGCPRDLIYTARHALERLMGNGAIGYISGVTVKRVEETSDGVRIFAVDKQGERCFIGARVFIAAGVLNTTEIMLRSFDLQQIEIKDSQYFIFPLFLWRGAKNVVTERLHTLAQLFIEIDDSDISQYGVHLQVYSYNDFISATLKQKLGWLYRFFPKKWFLNHMMVVQGYLHSADSGTIEVRLDSNNSGDLLVVNPIPKIESRDKVLRVLRKIKKMARLMRALPMGALLQMTDPGRGFHAGGSFPMAVTPKQGQTDKLGRPLGMTRIHLVDASIFPDIAATTITLTVMANAWRIGHYVACMEGQP